MFKNTSILIGGLLTLFSMVAQADPGVSLSESKIKSKIGTIVAVDLMMSDFASTEGGGIDMHFDPAIIQVNNVVVDNTIWNFASRNGYINNAEGTVTGILFSSYNGISGDAKIATVELEFIAKGRGKIVLNESESNPFASNGEQIAVTFKSSNVRVHRAKRNRK